MGTRHDPTVPVRAAYSAKQTRWLRIMSALIGVGFLVFGITRLAEHDYLGAIGPFLVVLLVALAIVIFSDPARASSTRRTPTRVAWCVVLLSIIFNILAMFL